MKWSLPIDVIVLDTRLGNPTNVAFAFNGMLARIKSFDFEVVSTEAILNAANPPLGSEAARRPRRTAM